MITLLKNPATAKVDPVTTPPPLSWLNPGNCFTSNNAYANSNPAISGDQTILDTEVYLQTDDNTLIGDNKADTSTAWSTTESYITYGGESDKWNATLTPAIVNATNFGVGVACIVSASGSTRVYASNFAFSIPTSAVIRGIQVDVEKHKIYNARSNFTTANIDHIRMTIFYGFPHLNHFE